jgi:Flp pilus assembly protein protease CpaA
MNYYTIIFLLIILPFSYFAMKQDIKERRVSNVITFSFMYLSFLVFLFFLTQHGIFDHGIVILGCLISFILYKSNFWGAADGKIFISIIMLIVALKDEMFVLNYLLNIIFFYTFVIITLITFKTKQKTKYKVFKTIDFGFYLFYLLILFIFIKNFIRSILEGHIFLTILLILSIYIIINKTNGYIRSFYEGLRRDIKVIANILLVITFLYIANLDFMIYFVIIYILRISIEFFSNMTHFLQDENKEQYHTPFSVYLFFALIFTIIVQENIATIIMKFIT